LAQGFPLSLFTATARARGTLAGMEIRYSNLPGDASGQREVKARSAFKDRDVQKSVEAHQLGPAHKEPTNEEGKFLKPIVFGGLDGISTIFAFLSGAVGANLSLVHIVALGCAQLFAGAFGMGLGEYLSSEAERQLAQREVDREHWEVENNPDGEVNEMIHIYMDKGLTQEDATVVAKTLSKYKDFWVEHMMLTEIGMIPPEGGSKQAMVQGLIMFSSFLTLGGLPLIAYVVSFLCSAEQSNQTSFAITCLAAITSMFLLGVLQAQMADNPRIRGGVYMAVQGALSAGGAFLIGTSLPEYLDLSVS